MPGKGKKAAIIEKKIDIQSLLTNAQNNIDRELLQLGLNTFITQNFLPSWEENPGAADSAWKRPTTTKANPINIQTIDGTAYKLTLSHSVKLLFTQYQQNLLDQITKTNCLISNNNMMLARLQDPKLTDQTHQKKIKKKIDILRQSNAQLQQRIEMTKASFLRDYADNGISFIVLPTKKQEKIKHESKEPSHFKGQGSFGAVFACQGGGIITSTQINIQEYENPLAMKYSYSKLQPYENLNTAINKLEADTKEEQETNALMDSTGRLKKLAPIPIRRIENDDKTITIKQYVIMECHEGKDLRTLLRRKNTSLTAPQALSIFNSILADVKRLLAHKKHHTDLKTINIILTQESARLIDFAENIGTSAYLPPSIRYKMQRLHSGSLNEQEKEQLMLYSLGVILFNLVFPSIQVSTLGKTHPGLVKALPGRQFDYDFSQLNESKYKNLFPVDITHDQKKFLVQLMSDLATSTPKIETFADLEQRLQEAKNVFPHQSDDDYAAAFRKLYGEELEIEASPAPLSAIIDAQNINPANAEIEGSREDNIPPSLYDEAYASAFRNLYEGSNAREPSSKAQEVDNIPRPNEPKTHGSVEVYSLEKLASLYPGWQRVAQKYGQKNVELYYIDPSRLDEPRHQRLIGALLQQTKGIIHQGHPAPYPCELVVNNVKKVYLIRPLQTIIPFQRMKNGTPQVDPEGNPLFRHHTFDSKNMLAHGTFGAVYKTTSTIETSSRKDKQQIAKNKKDFKIRCIKKVFLQNQNIMAASTENTLAAEVGLKAKPIVRGIDPDLQNAPVGYTMMQLVPGTALYKATPHDEKKDSISTDKDVNFQKELNNLTLKERLQWSRAIIDNLRMSFHERKIFHGDISDNQILISSKANAAGEIRASARTIDCGMSEKIGNSSLFSSAGTAWYYARDKQKTAASDVFSLAVLLVEIYGGKVTRTPLTNPETKETVHFPSFIQLINHPNDYLIIESLFANDIVKNTILTENQHRIRYVLQQMLMKKPEERWDITLVSDFFAFIAEQSTENKPAFFTENSPEIITQGPYTYIKKLDAVDRLLWCLRTPNKVNQHKLPEVIKSVILTKNHLLTLNENSTLNDKLINHVIAYLRTRSNSLSVKRIADCYELLTAARDIGDEDKLRLKIANIVNNMEMSVRGYEKSLLCRNLLALLNYESNVNNFMKDAPKDKHKLSLYLLNSCKEHKIEKDRHTLKNDLLDNIISYLTMHSHDLNPNRSKDIKKMLAVFEANKDNPNPDIFKTQLLCVIREIKPGLLHDSQLRKMLLSTINAYQLLKTDTLIQANDNAHNTADNLLGAMLECFKGHTLKKPQIVAIANMFTAQDHIGNTLQNNIVQAIKDEKRNEPTNKRAGIAWKTLTAVLDYIKQDFKGSQRRADAIHEVLLAIKTYRDDKKHGMDNDVCTHRLRETVRTIANKIKRQESGFGSTLKSRLYDACDLHPAKSTAVCKKEKKAPQSLQVEEKSQRSISIRDKLSHGFLPPVDVKSKKDLPLHTGSIASLNSIKKPG